ncbi:hypothetical protein [Photobacterium minamisatsumaniensis]|uniref:hypothetical protein n=1 Tax=Photobacterium minamisatsumaniensis TaxID=2910233 RepID=UPI003D0F0294
MSNRLKRISYSIFLDPLNNPADLYASKVLHQWAEELTRLNAATGNENSVALHNATHVHKQVYLSGLFLHLLNPELSQQLSAQLTEAQVTEFTLGNTLKGLGYNSASSDSAAGNAAQAELFEMLKNSICQQVKDESALTREQLGSAPVSSLLIETENVIGAVSDAMSTTAEQNSQLINMIDSQAKELAELKTMLASQQTLIRNLSKNTVGTKANSVQEEAEPVIDLNERLAHVQKIKKKGIF